MFKPPRFVILWLFLFVLFTTCKKERLLPDPTPIDDLVIGNKIQIRSCDVSFLPQIRLANYAFKNANGVVENPLVTLKNGGFNTIRLRVWNNPTDGHSSLTEVSQLAAEAKALGLKVWLTLHFSDTWADPTHQQKPALWQNVTTHLGDSVYAFTALVAQTIQPDFIQIGNEINNGFLWPEGSISNVDTMRSLLNQGISAVRAFSPNSKIILHYAGINDASTFFNVVSILDYDMIGLSYYPIWHGKNLTEVDNMLSTLSIYNKQILIAETSYPFTLTWNDNTTNIIGDTSQILPTFPATPRGQALYIKAINNVLVGHSLCIGFCYWGGEWVAYKGSLATDGSTWENQALWDFNGKALPLVGMYAK